MVINRAVIISDWINGLTYCRMANFSVCFISPFFPECFQTGINNTGKNNPVHGRT